MSRRNPAFPSAVGSIIPNIKRVCTVVSRREGTVAKSFILPCSWRYKQILFIDICHLLRGNLFYKLVELYLHFVYSLDRKFLFYFQRLTMTSTPSAFLMCSSLLFKTDTLVNNSFLHLPPSFSLDYFLVSWLFLIEVFRSPPKAEPLFADK